MLSLTASFLTWSRSAEAYRLYLLIAIIFVVFILARIIRSTIVKSINDNSSRYRVRKAVNMAAYVVMVIAILFTYSERLGSVGIALGVAGAGIAFALQEVIVSFAGWLNLMMSGRVQVGDRVKIGDVRGDIIDIGVLTTTIMEVGDWIDGDLYNGRIVTLANSFMFKEKINNYSSEFPFLWDEITVPVRTESDYRKAKQVFSKVLDEVCSEYSMNSQSKWNDLTKKYRIEPAMVKPMVSLKFDENWITFTLRYVVDYRLRRTTKDEIYTKLLDEIALYDDIIMIATSTLEVTSITQPQSRDKK